MGDGGMHDGSLLAGLPIGAPGLRTPGLGEVEALDDEIALMRGKFGITTQPWKTTNCAAARLKFA
jgi:hypothetical protein